MFFGHGVTVHGQRPRLIHDPMSQTMVEGDWTDPIEEPIEGVGIGPSSTSMLSTDGRTGALESVSLYCEVDVRVHRFPRFRQGATVYERDGLPAEFINPFTGWEAGTEIPLKRVVG